MSSHSPLLFLRAMPEDIAQSWIAAFEQQGTEMHDRLANAIRAARNDKSYAAEAIEVYQAAWTVVMSMNTYMAPVGSRMLPVGAVKVLCTQCGSSDCGRDAVAVWDATLQSWVLGTVYDDTWCDGCGHNNPGLDEVPM